jgi:hypothetical protein
MSVTPDENGPPLLGENKQRRLVSVTSGKLHHGTVTRASLRRLVSNTQLADVERART